MKTHKKLLITIMALYILVMTAVGIALIILEIVKTKDWNLIDIIFLIAILGTTIFADWMVINLIQVFNAVNKYQKFNRAKQKSLAMAISTTLILPLFIRAAEENDAPGAVLIGLVFVSIPWAIYLLFNIFQGNFITN